MHRLRIVAGLLGTVLVAGACGNDRDASLPTTSTSAPATPLAVQIEGQSYSHRSVPLTGTLSFGSDGCWFMDLEDDVTRPVVFPAGTTRGAVDSVITPAGEELAGGAIVDARGGVVPSAALNEALDGSWGEYLERCGRGATGVVVVDSLESGFLPEALTAEQLRELALGASLTSHWPCGVGFAVSDQSQRVSIVISAVEPTVPLSPPVALPDDRWTAELLVGKNLMAEWCNDAVEQWVSWPQVVARWPLVAGTLDFTPPDDGYLYQGAPVAAILQNARVSTPAGPIDLADVELLNEHFGVFAG